MRPGADQSTDRRLLRLHPDDNCLVAVRPLPAGEMLLVDGAAVKLELALPVGHKVAARHLGPGEAVVKCGAIIGRTSTDVAAGQYLHLHNVLSNYLAAHLVGGASTGGPGPTRRPT